LLIKKTLAEFMGTFILVFVGSMGILSVGGANGAAEIVAIAFAFGLALLAGIWTLGHVSGAHFNPAVTLAMLLERRTMGEAIGYWIGQFAGATVASLVLMAASSRAAIGGTNTSYAFQVRSTQSRSIVCLFDAASRAGSQAARAV
jgi:aquaporin Z